MKNDDNFSKNFKIAWAYMPLDDYELEKIEYNHRKRPYLLCVDKGNYYYAFACTSQIYTSKIRYQNEKVIMRTVLDDKKTLVNLGEIVKLPKSNIISEEKYVYKEYENEIIKKINACIKYCTYPKDFSEFFQAKKYSYDINDLVEVDGSLYVVVGCKGKNALFLLKVYTYPVLNTVEAITDDIKYYVDISNIIFLKRENVEKYHTQLFGFSFGDNTKNKEDLEELSKVYSQLPKVNNVKDYSAFANLESGMIISYRYREKNYKMIILENNGKDLEVIVGNDSDMYKTFQPMNLPSNTEFSYKVVGTLTNDRVEKLIEVKNNNLLGDSKNYQQKEKTNKKNEFIRVQMRNGRRYRCNVKIYGVYYDIYYCEDNIIIENGVANLEYTNKSKYLLIDQYIIDLENNTIFPHYKRQYEDGFIESINSLGKIKTINVIEGEENKIIEIYYEDNKCIKIETDKYNAIIGYENNYIEEIASYFLDDNIMLQKLNIPRVRKINSNVLFNNKKLKEIDLPNVEEIGDYFLPSNECLERFSAPKVKIIGLRCLEDNNSLKEIDIPNVEEIGFDFLKLNNTLKIINVPKLRKKGTDFLDNNTYIDKNKLYDQIKRRNEEDNNSRSK